MDDVFELNLSSDEDAPMTLALDRGVGFWPAECGL